MDILYTILHGLAVATFALSLAWAAASDLRRFEIPNRVSGAIVLSFAVVALLRGDLGAVAQSHVLAGLGVLAVGVALFAARVLGGGDVKLLAATSLWIGWPQLMPYLLWMAFAGGVIALSLILFRRLGHARPQVAFAWMRRLHARKRDVPYAVAIAMPALCLMPALPLVTGAPLP